MLLNNEFERNHLMNEMKIHGVETIFHYIPLHISPMGERLGYKKGQLKVTEDLSGRLLRLPMYPGLTDAEINYIIEMIYKYI